jgi:aspartate/methionine/tyrosine aminotransferase
MSQMNFLSSIRSEARGAPESGIVEVMNYGRIKPGLIPLWAGEGDLPTPDFIAEAATKALQAGETFYTWQRGLPELRKALGAYHAKLYGRHSDPDRFFVTGSGMQALQIAVRLVGGAGDEVLIPTPAWPNFAAAFGITGAQPVSVPMTMTQDGWQLDLARLSAAVSPATRAIVINSPANPTGWTATREELAAILALARQHGLWIIADEIYGRFVFNQPAPAPSFRDVMDATDRVLFVQTFSKNWAMTGWRIGWLEAPAQLGPVIENLIQYSTSGVAAFMQRAAIAALEHGEAFVTQQVIRAKAGRDIVEAALGATGRVRFAPTPGAFYLFFTVEGENDSRKLAMRLVDEAGVGLAPGTAFGLGAEACLRLCFARSAADLTEASARLAHVLGS